MNNIKIIDMHTHLWEANYEKDKAEILKACDLYGIHKVYVSAMFSRNRPKELNNPEKEAVSAMNEKVYSFKCENQEKVEGMVYVNPIHVNALDELKRGIEEYGFKAMKLKPPVSCDSKVVYPVIEQCIRYNIPILICTWFKKTESYCQVLTPA